MPGKRANRVREQVVVYLDRADGELLDEIVDRTGLAKTEVFRRGLRRLADEVLSDRRPGSSLAHLVATSKDDEWPADLSERHDEYLYGGGYEGGGEGAD